MIRSLHVLGSTLSLVAFAFLTSLDSQILHADEVITPGEARAVAKEAYTYANPVVDSYRVIHGYFLDPENPEFKGPLNEIKNIPRVYTHEDKAVQTPNSDTPYSWLGLDLRAEPFVLTVPKIEKDRYFSIQLIDLYTHNFAYIGSRTTGNDGGSFLIAGPGWDGAVPEGITKVFRPETELILAVYRTQLFNPDDLEKVKAIQSRYKVEKLSSFLGKPAAGAAPAIDFIEPVSQEEVRESPKVFEQLNFVLQFCPTHPSEVELMKRFARLNIGAGMTFDWDAFSPEIQEAIGQGIADAWADFGELKKKADAGELGSGDAFGTREHLDNNYLYRMAAAVLGIWGNSEEESIYPAYYVDANGEKLDGSHRYTLRFAPDQLPPVEAFWSLTMYELPTSLLTENPLDRYLLNSPMLEGFVRDDDGGITLYLQDESPGKDKEANWLPAPAGPFSAILRLYWPKKEALDGTWTMPPLARVE
ncbi:DUF1254 domain-containing protein [Novipirellula artificiosorum]|uniref:DUF1254 domain-containing protein n=1 Tax=Novipirellula artificiosorum TaxID=2528016 RepID=A0A5C6CY95_9BACT|nr:DUF1254 domain-containing protein [Novipirellula artificiosorum]TWU27966.1 hypothetical protein Poly41_69890 [Novipirellula artificiosorum]